jgi:hypothetical protein
VAGGGPEAGVAGGRPDFGGVVDEMKKGVNRFIPYVNTRTHTYTHTCMHIYDIGTTYIHAYI